METFQLLAIELGDFSVGSIGDVLWFTLGVLVLTGLTALVMRLNRQTRPDPFE